MSNSFDSNADQGTGSSAEENMMLNKMLEMFSAMEEKLAVRDAAMEKKLAVRDAAMDEKLAERDAAMKKEFDDLKKKLEDKEDEAWRGKHGQPCQFLSFPNALSCVPNIVSRVCCAFFISLSWRELFTTIHLFATAISLAIHLVAVFIYTWIIGIYKGFVQLFSITVIFAMGLLFWPVHRFVVRKIIRSSRRNV